MSSGFQDRAYWRRQITVDIPDRELGDAMKFTQANTKRDAIVTATTELNRRHRMAELVKYSGTSDSLMTVGELKKLRRKD